MENTMTEKSKKLLEIIIKLRDWIWDKTPTMGQIDDKCFDYLNKGIIDNLNDLDYIKMRCYQYLIIHCDSTKTVPKSGY